MKKLCPQILFLLVFTLLLSVGVLCAAAADRREAGFVVAVRGQVELISPDGASVRPKSKQVFYEHDVVKTGKRGRIQLYFEDDSVACLGRNTEMEITEFLFDATKKDGKMTLNVKEGIFRVMGGAITKVSPNSFVTKTPTATVGIRGTTVNGKASFRRSVIVLEATNGGGLDINGHPLVTPGFGVTVGLGGKVSAPTPMELFLLNMAEETGMGGRAGVRMRRGGGGTGGGGGGGTGGGGGPEARYDGVKLNDLRLSLPLLEQGLKTSVEKLEGGFAIAEDDITVDGVQKNTNPDDIRLALSGGKVVLGTFTLDFDPGTPLDPIDPINSNDPVYPGERSGIVTVPGSLSFPVRYDISGGKFIDNEFMAVDKHAANYVTANRGAADYLLWGEWALTQRDPNAVASVEREGILSRVLHGLWVGSTAERTDLSALQISGEYVLRGNFVGRYSGDAHALRSDSTMFHGTSQYTAYFGSSPSLTGSMSMLGGSTGTEALSFDVAAGIGSDGLITGSAALSGRPETSGAFNGAFFNNAQGLGASFNASDSVHSYTGVTTAAGNITNTTP